MSLSNLAMRTGIPEQRLENATNIELLDDEVKLIANELAVPLNAFYATTSLRLSDITDFRSRQPKRGLFHKGTIRAIGYVEKLSGALASLPIDLESSVHLHEENFDLTSSEAEVLARQWRALWGITDHEQLEFKSSHTLYSNLRFFVEQQGIIVLHFSFGTDEVAGIYARIDDGPRTILINTSHTSKARKLFTLAHEFCHVLLRQTGASNPSITNNKVEKFCNHFAAHLLAPTNLIEAAISHYGYTPSVDGSFIRLLASNLGISQQCCVIRLVEMGVFTNSQYKAWNSQFEGIVPPADMDDGIGGSVSIDPLRNKKTQYGHTLLHLLAEIKKSGALDDIDIYRLSGIKPKYQVQLFEA